jgi:hypothetical protein
MRYEYVVILKKGKDKAIHTTSIILCSISILSFIYQQVRSGEINIFLSVAVLILAIGIFLQARSTKNKKDFSFRIWLWLAGIFWLGMPGWKFLSIPFFLLGFLEAQARHPLEIGFTDESVVINSLIRKIYPWSAFNNIILKDGLLTLDFKNNTLIQKEAEEDDDPDAEEDEFNAYCSNHLQSQAMKDPSTGGTFSNF